MLKTAGPAHGRLAHRDHHQAGAQHAGRLEHVGPDDGLDAAEAGVEDADGEGYKDGEVHVDAGDLDEGDK